MRNLSTACAVIGLQLHCDHRMHPESNGWTEEELRRGHRAQVAPSRRAHRGGKTQGEIAAELEVSAATLYIWRRPYGGMGTAAAKELEELREQNDKLKRLLAQALDRTQPSLPMVKGRGETMLADHRAGEHVERSEQCGRAVPFVVVGRLPKYRHNEFLTFLRTIDRAVPQDLAVHLIVDNFPRTREVPPAAHKHENVRVWLDKHPRF